MIVNLFISIICQLTGDQKSTEAQQAGRLVKKYKVQSVKQASKIQTSQLLFIGLVDSYDPA